MNKMIDLEPKRIGKLTGLYNEPMSFKECIEAIVFIGIPFSFIFAIIFTLVAH